ncbi:MAG: hypothetical protein IJ491_08995 [Clostridia bacterium]|nr:hypothetical protein [Clostridia bacterium]
MKKILQRTFIVLGVFVVVIIAAVASLTHDSNKTSSVIATDAAGNTYYVYEDKEKDTTFAVVTDAEGNRYAAEFDGNTVGNTVENINDKVALEEVPTNFTGQHTEVTFDASAFIGEVVTSAPTTSTVPSTTVPSTVVDQPDVSTTAPAVSQPGSTEAYRINKFQRIFAGGTYLMEFTDKDLSEEPVTMAIKNGNMFIDVTMEEMKLKMLYKNDVKTMYLIIDEFKKYCKLPEDLLGDDMDIGEMMSDFSVNEVGNVTVSEVELNGQTLILESYTDSDGTTYNYYFSGEDMVRRDTINPDGTTDSMYISKFTTDVPDSTFEIPDGYGYLNLSWLGAMV